MAAVLRPAGRATPAGLGDSARWLDGGLDEAHAADTQAADGEAVMERSVTESPRASKRGRIVRWAEGVLVGIAIFTLVVLGFDWLMAATP